MGKSVMNGAIATFIPSLTPCCRACEITRVVRGPGENPADNPKTIPVVRKKSITAFFSSSHGQSPLKGNVLIISLGYSRTDSITPSRQHRADNPSLFLRSETIENQFLLTDCFRAGYPEPIKTSVSKGILLGKGTGFPTNLLNERNDEMENELSRRDVIAGVGAAATLGVLSHFLTSEALAAEPKEAGSPPFVHMLPPLPYPEDALEPVIDKETVKIHHDMISGLT